MAPDDLGAPEPGARLCIFARAPVRGHVKRRLAGYLGVDGALAAHVRLAEETLDRLQAVPGTRTELWLSGPTGGETVRSWLRRYPVTLHPQSGADLGERMWGAIATALGNGVPGLVVGIDCPGIDAAYVGLALEHLRRVDVVFGPAEDGGYGLVGAATASAPQLEAVFRNVPWGTDRVLDVSLQNCRHAGLKATLLPMIWDVDTAADWHRYLAERESRE